MVVSFFLTFFKIPNSPSLFVYIASEEDKEYVN